MAADYGKKLYDQLEEALIALDLLKEDVRALKEDNRALKRNYESQIKAIEAQNRKDIKQIHEDYAAKIKPLNACIATLEAENAKLKSQINKNSGNSNKPPSSDGFKQIPNSREKTGRKPGGQKGHKGHVPILSETPDEIQDCRKTVCDCGGHVAYDTPPTRKQLLDIMIKATRKEYWFGAGQCESCGKKISAPVPRHLGSAVNIGAGVKALAMLLVHEGAVSINRTNQILSQITNGGVCISNGSIANFTQELSANMESAIDEIKDRIIAGTVAHKDETGVKANGKQHWLHVLCTENAALYDVSEKRGAVADDDMGVLGSYGGTLVHDHWKALYGFSCKHAECNVHIVRYLKGVIENEKTFADVADRLLKLLLKMNNTRNDKIAKGEKNFSDKMIVSLEKQYVTILTEWNAITDAAEAERKRKKLSSKYKPDAELLGKRLLEFKDQHLLFLHDFEVPFGNNLAERSLRMAKTKIKVSGGFRSKIGARDYARIRSCVTTMARNKKCIFDGLLLAFNKEPVPLF